MQTNRYDIEGPWQLVRAVDVIGMDTGQGWRVIDRPGVYDALCEVADRYAAAHAKDGKDARYITFRAALAWRKEKYPEARRYLDKVGERVVPDAFKIVAAENPELSIAYIYAVTSPQKDIVNLAETARREQRFADAEAAVREAQSSKDLHPRAKPYFEWILKKAESNAKWARGEWLDAQPSKDLGPWTRYGRAGRWYVDADGALIGTTPDKFRTTIYLNWELGDRVQFAGTVQPTGDGHPTPGPSFTQRDHPPVYASFMMPGVGLDVGNERFELPTDAIAKAAPGPVAFLWTYDRGVISLRVGDADVIVRRALDNVKMTNAYPGLHVSFGGAKFTGLKVRKIVDPAPPPPQ